MSRYKPYSKYKPSGVEWIGDVPVGWEVRKIGHTSYVKGRIGWQGLTASEFVDDGPYCVTGTDFCDGIINWHSCYHVSEERYCEDPYIQLKEQDLLITKDGTIGKVALVTGLSDKATLNSGIFLLRPISNAYLTEYMYWVLNSEIFNNFIKALKTGTTISHLYQNIFVKFQFPYPQKNEQKQIANFLDKKTAQIDELIDKKEKMIELLKEKRSAIINQAVTKGLDPRAKMKPSGIDWIGEIPVGWEVRPIKRIVEIPVTDGPHETPELFDEGIPFISAEAVKGERLDFSRKRGFISPKEHLRLSRKYKPKKGDIYMVKSGATTGNIAIVETDEEFNIWSPLAVIRANQGKILTQYIFKFMKSKSFFRSVELTWSYGTQQNIGMGVIENLPVTVPPINEQKQIANFLDKKTARIDDLIVNIEKAIEKLREYRTAIITAAVTGKIDVRKKS